MLDEMRGPLLSDEEFFRDCLDLEREDMGEVREFAEKGDYCGAEKTLARALRAGLAERKEGFLKIPYENPENIFRYPDETDEQACERLLSHILISVGVPCDYGKENEIDWLANPTYNHYEEWTWQLNRHNEWKMLAHEYNRTKDARYAALTAEFFESWVHQAVRPELTVCGTDTKCWRTIECGIRMGANWPYVLFTFFDTDAFTDEVLVDWYRSVWEHGRRLHQNRTHGNWLIMEMNGLAQIGMLYPQFKQSKEWLETAFSALEAELSRQIYPDGFQYELSTGYHDVVINNYQRVIRVAEALDIPVPEALTGRLTAACEIDVKLMMPNGYLPDINDGSNALSRKLLEPKLPLVKGHEAILWAATGGEKGKCPEYCSVALPYSGFFAMRSGWKKDDVWALLDAAPFGRGHQHEDKLSLLLFAEGKYLLTEGGNYAYDDSKMRRYVLSSRAHNTVLVDGKGQNRRASYVWKDEDIGKHSGMKWGIGDTYDWAEGCYEEAYGGDENGPDAAFHKASDQSSDQSTGQSADQSTISAVRHTRTVYFIKKAPEGLKPFFIVCDRLESVAPHTYDLLWHVDSENPVISENGVDTDELAVSVSIDKKSIEVIRGREEPEWQGFIATGTKQGQYREVNCISVHVPGDSIRVVTVLCPHSVGETAVCRVNAGEGVEDGAVEVVLTDGRKYSFQEEIMRNGK